MSYFLELSLSPMDKRFVTHERTCAERAGCWFALPDWELGLSEPADDSVAFIISWAIDGLRWRWR